MRGGGGGEGPLLLIIIIIDVSWYSLTDIAKIRSQMVNSSYEAMAYYG